MTLNQRRRWVLWAVSVFCLGLSAAACIEVIEDGEPILLISFSRTLPIGSLETGVEDVLHVFTTGDEGRLRATWARGRLFPAEEDRCGLRTHLERILEIPNGELSQAISGLTERMVELVDWSAHTRLGCLMAGRNPYYLLDYSVAYAEWVGDVPPAPLTVEALRPIGELWNRVMREGTPFREDIPVPADEEGLWPPPEWSLGE